jgi:hypothetical protein
MQTAMDRSDRATTAAAGNSKPVKLRLKPNETQEVCGVRITLVEPVPGHGRKREILVQPVEVGSIADSQLKS